MPPNQQPPSVPKQEFDWKNTTNVSKAMIKAGSTKGKSRIAAGVRAAWNAKTSSMYGEDSTKIAMGLRLLGQDNLAKWYDRFLAKESKKKDTEKRRHLSGDDGYTPVDRQTKKLIASSVINTGLLKAQSQRLNSIHGLLGVIASDVSDIKSLILPKVVIAKGRKGTEDEGTDQLAQYNPLAPEGQQFKKVSETGKLLAISPGKNFKDSAIQKATLASAQLALKIQDEDQSRGELRKKFSYNDELESITKEDPLEKVNTRLTSIEKELKDKGEEKSSFLSKLMSPIMLMWKGISSLLKMFGKAGLVAMSGVIGYEVGTYLNKKYKLDEKINDFLDKHGFTKNEEAGRKASATDSMKDIIDRTNKKLRGSGWSMVGQGLWRRESDGVVFKTTDLPDEAKAEFKGSGLAGFQNYISKEQIARNERNGVSTPKAVAPAPPSAQPTGNLSSSKNSYDERVVKLGNVIASGESKGDYNVYNKGTIGKNKGKTSREDLSKMTISEYLRRGKLGENDPQKMFAVGKYQIIPETMKAAVDKLGLDPNTTTLSPATQEKIFKEFLIKSKRPKIHNYLIGKSDDINGALMEMAQEWASIGVPYDTVRNGQVIKKGQSYYAGIGGNKAHTGVNSIVSSIKPTPTLSASVLDSHSRTMAASNSPAATVAMITPIINAKTNQNVTPAYRSIPKADTFSSDSSFLRAAGQDIVHPTSMG